MAGSVNKVTLVGNLGKDPEIRNTQSGMKIVNLRIATSESWNDKASGERQERTEWHSVVIMNDRLADVAERYLRKGSKVYLEGKLQTRKWTDQSGQDRYTTEVMLGRIGAELVLLDRVGEGGAAAPSSGGDRGFGGRAAERPAGRAPAGAGWDSGGGRGGDLDDEIPF
jgi:single-strand DNA-binding protein